MIRAHQRLSNPGEVDFLFDQVERDPTARGGWCCHRDRLADDRILRATDVTLPDSLDGADLVRDLVRQMDEKSSKLLTLNIHRNASRMHAIFPDAPVVHLLRDPRDVARSAVGMGWAGNSYHATHHWIDTERDWDKARIPAGRVLTLVYEDLMQAPEDELDRMVAFLGDTYDPAMLEYYKNTTYDPPDPALCYQWRKRAGEKEVARLEAAFGDLMAARGYEPSAPGHVPA